MRIGFIDSGVGGLSILSAVRACIAGDYIYVMDRNNYKDVIQMAKSDSDKQKVRLLLDEIFPGEKRVATVPEAKLTHTKVIRMSIGHSSSAYSLPWV